MRSTPGTGSWPRTRPSRGRVIDAGLTWIGPPPAAIDALGDKVAARRIAQEVGAPLVPGTDGPVSGADEVRAFAARYGLPVAIKAAHGGGGRGLKVARTEAEIGEMYESAVREAVAAFGRGECFVERYLERPRHVETQCLADAHGGVVVVSTRDCSLQRRHQKLVEEAPAPFLSSEQVAVLYDASKAIMLRAGYTGAGTCEFLVGQDGTISFLEVNTRLQVEHPVSEEVTGIDLVREMFRIADGQELGYGDPATHGHAIEFRVNAEDPGRGFLPAPGTITRWRQPSGPGVRVDAGYGPGMTVPQAFDSLLAKLIVTGADRPQALERARRALTEFEVGGMPTVLPFHRRSCATRPSPPSRSRSTPGGSRPSSPGRSRPTPGRRARPGTPVRAAAGPSASGSPSKCRASGWRWSCPPGSAGPARRPARTHGRAGCGGRPRRPAQPGAGRGDGDDTHQPHAGHHRQDRGGARASGCRPVTRS